jgi:hypothetical protein
LRTRLDRLHSERATITETRPFAAIEAELQRASPGAAAVWRPTARCHDVTLPESGQACATVLALRQALGTSQRRDTLDVDIRDAETQLARLPAVIAADPQAETATQLVNWVTFGLTKLAADDIRIARVAGMAFMPQIAGLVLMLATTLWHPANRRRLAECQTGTHDPWAGLGKQSGFDLQRSCIRSAKLPRFAIASKPNLERLGDTRRVSCAVRLSRFSVSSAENRP